MAASAGESRLANIVLSDGEIITSGSGSSYPAPGHFYILRPAGTGYEQVFVSRVFPGLVALGVADVTGDARQEIVVVQEDGRIALFDQRSREETGGFDVPGVADVSAAVLRDLDGNGKAEILLVSEFYNSDALWVVSGAGALLWQLADAGGYDLTVGNMDADASLEIATTSGKVVDWNSRTVQWTRAQGFGFDVDVGDIDGDGKQELIAAQAWDFIWAFDVDTQLPKWSMPIFNVGAISIGNADADPALELIVGDGQWGDVKAYNTTTLAEEWAIPNPGHGVYDVRLGDPNGNGVLDVMWSASSPERLYVANLATHSIDWESHAVYGPVRGSPVRRRRRRRRPRDRLRLVRVRLRIQRGSGRIIVFDGQTQRVRAISPPVVDDDAFEGLRDLRLRNVDADPQLEIVIAADSRYDGVIEIYDFAAPSYLHPHLDQRDPAVRQPVRHRGRGRRRRRRRARGRWKRRSSPHRLGRDLRLRLFPGHRRRGMAQLRPHHELDARQRPRAPDRGRRRGRHRGDGRRRDAQLLLRHGTGAGHRARRVPISRRRPGRRGAHVRDRRGRRRRTAVHAPGKRVRVHLVADRRLRGSGRRELRGRGKMALTSEGRLTPVPDPRRRSVVDQRGLPRAGRDGRRLRGGPAPVRGR